MAKNYFESKNVSYSDINVAADHEKAHEMIEKTGQTGVPVIEIDDQIIIGFDQGRIEELLKEKGGV